MRPERSPRHDSGALNRRQPGRYARLDLFDCTSSGAGTGSQLFRRADRSGPESPSRCAHLSSLRRLIALALTTAASLAGRTPARTSSRRLRRPRARRVSAARGGLAAPARSSGPNRRISSPPAHASPLRVRCGRSVVVRAPPAGRVIGRLDSRTEFGSPEVLGAVKTDGRWLGVATTARPGGRLAWVDARTSALRATPAKASSRADLSRRRIELWRGEKVIERVSVAIGRPRAPRPAASPSRTSSTGESSAPTTDAACSLSLGPSRTFRSAGAAETGSRSTA